MEGSVCSLCSRGSVHQPFWDILVQKKLSVISDEECAGASYTVQEAQSFLQEEASDLMAVEDFGMAQEEQEPEGDLFDQLM
jgi:hypothetical protein